MATGILCLRRELRFGHGTLSHGLILPRRTSLGTDLLINTSWGEGSKNISYWCGDTKNKDLPIDYVLAGFDGIRQQFNDTKTGIQINLTLGIWLPNDAFFTIPEGILSKKSTIIPKTKSGIVEHYKTEYNLTLPNLATLQLISSALNYLNINFTIQIKANTEMLIINSTLSNHILIGTGKNKLSFDAEDLKETGFTKAYFRRSGGAMYLIMPPKNNTWQANDFIQIK